MSTDQPEPDQLPTNNWPKSYIFQVHQQAVAHGFIWLDPISAEDARSFTARFYRARRRADTSMAAFIPAEYHLVTVGRWEPGPTGTGRLPIIYSQRPDDVALPGIVPAEGGLIAPPPSPVPALPPAIPFPDPAELEIKPEDISGLVERLRQSARERDQ